MIEASKTGRLSSLQIAYLIYDRDFEKFYSVLFWNLNPYKKTALTETVENPLKITLK